MKRIALVAFSISFAASALPIPRPVRPIFPRPPVVVPVVPVVPVAPVVPVFPVTPVVPVTPGFPVNQLEQHAYNIVSLSQRMNNVAAVLVPTFEKREAIRAINALQGEAQRFAIMASGPLTWDKKGQLQSQLSNLEFTATEVRFAVNRLPGVGLIGSPARELVELSRRVDNNIFIIQRNLF